MINRIADLVRNHHSSSGGAVAALGVFALQAQKFAELAHIKANLEKSIFNIAIISCKAADVIAASGSRFALARQWLQHMCLPNKVASIIGTLQRTWRKRLWLSETLAS